MSTQPSLPFTSQKIERHRESKRQTIERFFKTNIGHRISSRQLHMTYGSAVRTRISEINRDKACQITIMNETNFKNGAEESWYWSAWRAN